MKIRLLRIYGCGALLALVAWWLPRQLAGAAVPAPGTVALDLRSLQPGDVIFRRGRDTVSAVVLAADGGSRFSHVGIIVPIGRLPAVVHALPDDAEHPEGRVRIEPVGAFIAPENASELAVYRLHEGFGETSGETAGRAARHALRYVREQRRFDNDFRLETPGELYCTELVWRAFREAGTDLLDGRFARLRLPLRSGDFVLPSSMTESPHLGLVIRKDIGP
jgi:hypothetical protein